MRIHSSFSTRSRSGLSSRGVSLHRFCVGLGLAVLLGACDGRRELSEWKPTDHQPPPTVAPEGQGTGQVASAPTERTETGRAAAALFEQRCASCHGVSGRGDGPGKPPGAAMPDLTSAAWAKTRSDEQLHAVIKNGRNMMPAFADQLTPLGIDALVGHVRTLSATQ